MNNILLTDERVILKPLELYDLEELLPYSLNEPDIWQFSQISAYGQENLTKYIEHAVAERDKGTSIPFIVFDKDAEVYVGTTRYYNINYTAKTLSIGYTWYGKDFQGTGLNTHCKYMLLAYAFDQLKMERVEFRADNENKRSLAAMNKIGCTLEGVLRQDTLRADGTRRDSAVLSILREEWYSTIQKQLEKAMIK